MSSVYTSLAKKRIEQSQKAFQAIPLAAERTQKEKAGKPANQHTGKPESHLTSKLASQSSSSPANQHSSKTHVQNSATAMEKVTYRFHAEGKYAVQDIKTILERRHGIKVSNEEIAEQSILLAYEDLLANQNASKLASRLARTPENKKSS